MNQTSRLLFFLVSSLVGIALLSQPRLIVAQNLVSIVLIKSIFKPAPSSASQGCADHLEYFLKPIFSQADKRSAERAHLALGSIYHQLGRSQRALHEWKLANSETLWVHLASLFWKEGDRNRSIEFSKRAILVAPTHLENYFLLAWRYWPGTGHTQDALQVYSQIAKLAAPGSFEENLAEGNIFRLQGQWSLALEKFEAATRVEPTQGDAHRLVAEAATKLGKYSVALEHLKRTIDLTPEDSWVYVELADVYRDAGQYPEALRWYAKAAHIYAGNPGIHKGYVSLGELFLKRGFFDWAAGAFISAIRLSPETESYHYRLGLCYQGAGKLDKAVREYKKTLELNSDFKPAKQALAQLLKQ